jgi:hypothetical protein
LGLPAAKKKVKTLNPTAVCSWNSRVSKFIYEAVFVFPHRIPYQFHTNTLRIFKYPRYLKSVVQIFFLVRKCRSCTNKMKVLWIMYKPSREAGIGCNNCIAPWS